MSIPLRSVICVMCYMSVISGIGMCVLPESAFLIFDIKEMDNEFRIIAGIIGLISVVPAIWLHRWTLQHVTDAQKRKQFYFGLRLIIAAILGMYAISMISAAFSGLSHESLRERFNHIHEHLSFYMVVVVPLFTVGIVMLWIALIHFNVGNRIGKLVSKEQFEQAIAMGEKYRYNEDQLFARVNLAFAYIGAKRIKDAQSLYDDLKQVTDYKGLFDKETYELGMRLMEIKLLGASGQTQQAIDKAMDHVSDLTVQAVLVDLLITSGQFPQAQEHLDQIKQVKKCPHGYTRKSLNQLIENLDNQLADALLEQEQPHSGQA